MAEQELVPTSEGAVDDEESDLPAGYTYFGQLVDHDLTLDARPNDLTTPVDPTTLTNGRTPRLDLDQLYGLGPSGSPELYEPDRVHLRYGGRLTGSPDSGAHDLPRDSRGRAYAGDPRQDENIIVSQLHSVLLRMHNSVADEIAITYPNLSAARHFSAARRSVVMHYQWAVLTDFLPRIVGADVVAAARTDPSVTSASCTGGLPVEFAVAAYRFGHSLVRPNYRLNPTLPTRQDLFSTSPDPLGSLGGFRPVPRPFAIDWRSFFPLPGPVRPQPAYRIDTSLAFPLSLIPGPAIGRGPAVLAQRNLLRGVQLGLPSGQDVARALRIAPLPDERILIGKATGDPADVIPITAVSQEFAGKAPLWSYILAEAGTDGGHRLGPVGGRIVAQTIVGLLAADKGSILNAPRFRPTLRTARGSRFGLPEMVRLVTETPRQPDSRSPRRR